MGTTTQKDAIADKLSSVPLGGPVIPRLCAPVTVLHATWSFSDINGAFLLHSYFRAIERFWKMPTQTHVESQVDIQDTFAGVKNSLGFYIPGVGPLLAACAIVRITNTVLHATSESDITFPAVPYFIIHQDRQVGYLQTTKLSPSNSRGSLISAANASSESPLSSKSSTPNNAPVMSFLSSNASASRRSSLESQNSTSLQASLQVSAAVHFTGEPLTIRTVFTLMAAVLGPIFQQDHRVGVFDSWPRQMRRLHKGPTQDPNPHTGTRGLAILEFVSQARSKGPLPSARSMTPCSPLCTHQCNIEFGRRSSQSYPGTGCTLPL